MTNSDALRRAAIAAAAAGALAGVPAAAAQHQGQAEAVVLRPLSLVKVEDLDFGSIISGPTGGTVTINPVTGARTTTGGVTPAGGLPQRAVFQGTGGFLLLTVSGSTSVTLTRIGGGASPITASLARAVSNGGGGITLLGATLFPSGVQTYYIGGTLNVPANQPPGDYSGTFTLTVNYL